MYEISLSDVNAKFIRWWLFLVVVVSLVLLVPILIISLTIAKEFIASLLGCIGVSVLISLIVGIITAISLRWQARVEVSAEWELVYEWSGKRIKPFKPGLYYPFPYLGFLNDGILVPTNSQILNILTGSRDEGIKEQLDDYEDYEYGSHTNFDPATGDVLKLVYKIEIECEDSLKLVYAKNDPYRYIAGMVEIKIIRYLKSRKLSDEQINDEFSTIDWMNELRAIIDTIKDDVGVEIKAFIPVDVINTPETEESRQGIMIEKRRREFLKEELKNNKVQQKISQIDDFKRVHTITSIIDEAGVHGNKALDYLATEKKLKAVVEAAKEGDMTFMDNSANGNLSGVYSMGWGFNAANKAADKKTQKEKKDDEAKTKK